MTMYMYVQVHIDVHVHVDVHVSIHVHVHVDGNVRIYVHLHLHVDVHVQAYVHVHVRVHYTCIGASIKTSKIGRYIKNLRAHVKLIVITTYRKFYGYNQYNCESVNKGGLLYNVISQVRAQKASIS